MSQNLSLRTAGGRGNVLVIGLIATIAVLVIIGLILPPISLLSRLGPGGGCKTLTAKNPSLDHPDGLSVALDANAKGTLAIKLASVDPAKLPDDLKAALKTLPKGYIAKGPVFQINACGTRAVPSTVTVAIPEGANPLEPLDLLTYNGKTWEWFGGYLDAANNVITAHVNEVPQNVVVAQAAAIPVGIASDMPASGNVVAEGTELVTVIFVPGLLPAEDGGINGDPAALPKAPEGSTAAQYPSVRNWARPGRFNAGLVSDMLADAKLRDTHVKVLTNLVAKTRYAGVQVDYRGLSQNDRKAFSDLVVKLGDALHQVNKKLAVVVPAPQPNDDDTWDTQGYDWSRIAAAADLVQLELPTDPAAYGSSSAEALVKWATSTVSRYKLYIGLTSLSVDQAGNDISLVSFEQALKPLGNVTGPQGAVTPGSVISVTFSGAPGVTFDNATSAYRYTYNANNQSRVVTLGTGGTLATKLNWALKSRVRGVAIHGLLDAGNDPGVFAAVQQYAAQTLPTGAPLQAAFTIQGNPAATLALTQSQFMLTAPSAPGSYTIGASVAGVQRGQASLTVGGAAVATPATSVTTTTGVTSTTGAAATPAECQLKVSFVSDVSVPDNVKFEKGAAFTKTWRVKNTGACDWPANTQLVFISGRKLGAAQTEFPVGAVKVGETKDISVDMKAPNEDASNLAGLWRLKSGSQTFGSLSVVIISGNPQAATPSQQQPPAAGGAPVAPPSSGPTLYGIHAHWAAKYNDEAGMDKTTSQIADLGLGWTKLQVRWGEEDYYYDCSGNFGYDWNHANQVINSAGAKGLRVLFSVVQSPPCTHPATGDVNVPPDDPNVFAAFVGEMASRYAGRGIAIEIWERENATPNLDATRYAKMLAASYNKIKSIDPGIIVIGGAPAPYVTGGDIEPFTYLQQIKAAGADKYMDCIGLQFNDSNSPPDTGPFKGFVQGYQSTLGKQACITSFGVASEQGVGHVPGIDFFKDVTTQNQADWVTQGMKLARDLGARMIILFNLDYGPLSGLNSNALYSFLALNSGARPVHGAVKGWCAANGCK